MFHILLKFDFRFLLVSYMVLRFGNNNSTLSFKFSKLLFSFTVLYTAYRIPIVTDEIQ